MKAERFEQVIEERLDKIRKVLLIKAKEYANDENRLHNFDKAAIKGNRSREQALDDYRLKHLVSLDDIRLKCSRGIFPTKEVIDEKIGDIINYYILEEACYLDRLDKEHKREYPVSAEEAFPYKIEIGDLFVEKNKDSHIIFEVNRVIKPDFIELVGVSDGKKIAVTARDIVKGWTKLEQKAKVLSNLVEGHLQLSSIIFHETILVNKHFNYRGRDNTKYLMAPRISVDDCIAIYKMIEGFPSMEYVDEVFFLENFEIWKQEDS